MNIYDYFKEYDDKYFKMKDKLIEIKEAENNFYSLTSVKFNAYPKNKNLFFGYDDQIARIEKLINEYKELEKEYLVERNKCLNEINKIKNALFRTILKLSFLEKKRNKLLADILNKNYKLDYSVDYVCNLKTKAIKEFENNVNKNE